MRSLSDTPASGPFADSEMVSHHATGHGSAMPGSENGRRCAHVLGGRRGNQGVRLTVRRAVLAVLPKVGVRPTALSGRRTGYQGRRVHGHRPNEQVGPLRQLNLPEGLAHWGLEVPVNG